MNGLGLEFHARRIRLQALGTVKLAQFLVECTQREVSSFTRDFEDEAIGESDLRLAAIALECAGNDIGILQGETPVTEQHFDHRGNPGVVEPKRASQNPNRLREHEVRNPGTSLYERIR